jgi:hypothetical protein
LYPAKLSLSRTCIFSSESAQHLLKSSSRRCTHSGLSSPFRSGSKLKGALVRETSGREVFPTLRRFVGRSGASWAVDGVNIYVGYEMLVLKDRYL